MEMNDTPIQIIKVKKNINTKSFRLIDFHTFDEYSNKIKNDDNSNDENEYDKGERKFVVQMFGLNETGQTCCINVDDYMPFFYVKVNDEWTQKELRTFQREILSNPKIKNVSSSLANFELVEHKKLYGFSAGKKHKFIKITFQNMIAFNKMKNLWYMENTTGERVRKSFVFKGTKLELYESNIPPILRYFHVNNISPSGWVQINVGQCVKRKTKMTSCHFEYFCSKKNIKPLHQKETRVPYKICSFDIEASSSHGDFPLPKKTHRHLSATILDIYEKNTTFLREDNKTKILIKRIIMTAFGYDNLEDVDIIYPKRKPTEKELIVLIDRFLKTPIIDAVKTIGDKMKKVQTIEDMFYNLGLYSKTNYKNQNENEYIGEENTDENHFQENEENDRDDVSIEDDTPPSVKKNIYFSNEISKISKTKTNIIDLLKTKEYERDEKINFINKLFAGTQFPELEGDKVTFIGSTFLNYGENEPYLNHCLVLGTCDEIPGIEIETSDTERELLLKWTELIKKEDPDIIIGYNIFGFDYEFMFRRSQENDCHTEFLKLSRKNDEICAKQFNNGDWELENMKIKLASGEYDLKYAKMAGRIQVDLYNYFRRDFNLPSYKLDDVAGQYIGDEIIKTEFVIHEEYGKITKLYSNNLTGLNKNDFIHLEIVNFTTDYFKNGKKFRVLEINKNKEEITFIDGKEILDKHNIIIIGEHQEELREFKKIKWGMSKDDVTPQDIFRLSNGSSSDRSIVAKYCVQDCNLVHHLMNKIDVITGYIEMSRICSVPISFLVFRGQGIKLTSFVAKKCMEKDTLMPDLEKSNDNSGYEGAIVLPPKCSIYMDNPVACVDYSSLYPSSMISQNYSHDSKVWSKEYDLEGNLLKETGEKDENGNYIYDNLTEFQYIDMEFDTFKYVRKTPTSKAKKTKSGKMICRWAQLQDNQKSIMPSILEELLKARSDTRKLIKTEKDPFMQNILDKRQLGYKVTANSLYGQCGSKMSTFYEKDVAASTTATGRMMIIYAKRIIEEVYGDMEYTTEKYGEVKCNAEYVYGDTDSVFFTFNLTNPITKEKIRGREALEITIEIAQDAANLCTKWLKPPMELSYEKTLMPFILLSKKRYVGMLYETNPNKGKLKYMGLSLKRRDSCDYLKDIYGGILNILMKENNIQKAIEFLDVSINNLIKGNVSMEKLAISKSLGSYYKNPQQIAHKVLSDRISSRNAVNKPKSGDRIKYLFIVNNNQNCLQGEKIETPEFIVENKLRIDYAYYITNQIMNPLQQLFGLMLVPIWENQNKMNSIKTYKKQIECIEKEFSNDYELFMKEKEKYCSSKVKSLIFDKYLNEINNEKNGMKSIKTFYFSFS